MTMTFQEPIAATLHQKFLKEKLIRVIEECDDIEVLRQISIQLLNLSFQKTAIADWATKLAWEADQSSFQQKDKKS